jgi:benzylsuccinate CoA-transferase BbsE subunit
MCGPFGAYAARLLADLGAHVTRVMPHSGDPVAREWPLVPTAEGEHSAYEWFVNLDKEFVALDLDLPADRARLDQLITEADILIESWGVDPASWGYHDRAELASRCPRLNIVSITPYGIDGPRATDLGTDLTALAAGGLLSLGGYRDTEPIATHGQARLAASIFGAAAAIFGLIARDGDGRGRVLDVAAQEVVAAALEDAIPQFDLTGTVRRRAGETAREAGTGVYRCADGYVSMVAGRLGTAKAWRSLVAWLAEVGVEGSDTLQQEAWSSLKHRQKRDSVATFREVFERFTLTQTKADLYAEAQRRDIALAPVNEVSEVLRDEQLAARHFFAPVLVDEIGREVLVPGRPYRLSDDSDFKPHRPAAATLDAEEPLASGRAAPAEAAARWTGAPARP